MNTKTKPVPAAPAAQEFVNCPMWGQGGQYTYDPATGLRTRVVDPASAPNEAVASTTDAGNGQAETGSTKTPVVKENKRA